MKAGARAALAGLLLVPLAEAATFTVTKTADTADGACDADCSLREAVIAANAAPGPDVIRLGYAVYKLTRRGEDDDDNALTGDLDLTDDVTLRGSLQKPSGASSPTAIDAGGIDRVLEVAPGVSALVSDVQIRGGRVAQRGGGVLNFGNLTLRGCWVLNNRVSLKDGVLQGGGIFNQGELRIVENRIQGNSAVESSAALQGGQGGGIFNSAGAILYVYDSWIRYNVTGFDDAHGTGAGLFNWGSARIDRTFFGYNDPGDGEGSAIANREGGTVGLFNSTVSTNGHDGADGAIANGTLTGARESAPKLTLLDSTIADNNGGGLLNSGRVVMRNSLIAGNYTQDGNDVWYTTGANCRNVGAATFTQSFSVIATDGNCPTDLPVPNDDPVGTLLEPLSSVGGPPYHAPKPGTVMVDGGSDTCGYYDQRKGRRPADGDGDGVARCDVGAVELNAEE